jgi:hypothetical protein
MPLGAPLRISTELLESEAAAEVIVSFDIRYQIAGLGRSLALPLLG